MRSTITTIPSQNLSQKLETLQDALKWGFQALLEKELKTLNLFAKDEDGKTLMVLAAEKAKESQESEKTAESADSNNWEIVEFLLDHVEEQSKQIFVYGGVKSYHSEDKAGCGKALIIAIEAGNCVVARKLIEAGAPKDCLNAEGQGGLHIAILNNDIKMRNLLAEYTDYKVLRNKEKKPVADFILNLALEADFRLLKDKYKKTTEDLQKDKDEKTEKTTEELLTPEELQQQLWDHFEYFSQWFLLPSSPFYSQTFIKLINEKRYRIVKCFLEKISVEDKTYIDEKGNTGLHAAITNHDDVMIKLILSYKQHSKDLKNKAGITPIELACSLNNESAVSLLIENYKKHYSLSKPPSFYQSALIIAIKNKNYSIVNLLLSIKTPFNHFDDAKKGNVAIYETFLNDDVEMLKLLLAEIDLSKIKNTRENKSVIDLATDCKALQCVELLNQIEQDNKIKKEKQAEEQRLQKQLEAEANAPFDIRRKFLLGFQNELLKLSGQRSFLTIMSNPREEIYLNGLNDKIKSYDARNNNQVNEFFDSIYSLLEKPDFTASTYDLKCFISANLQLMNKIKEDENNAFTQNAYIQNTFTQSPCDEPIYIQSTRNLSTYTQTHQDIQFVKEISDSQMLVNVPFGHHQYAQGLYVAEVSYLNRANSLANQTPFYTTNSSSLLFNPNTNPFVTRRDALLQQPKTFRK